MRTNFRIRPIAPLVALIALFVAVLAFSLFGTVREADRVDAARSRVAVHSAVDGKITQIAGIAEDNGLWDDAAIAVYQGMNDQRFFWSSWGVTTGQGTNYDGAVILDSRGNTLLAYDHGRAVRLDLAKELGAPLSILLSRLDRTGQPAGGIMRTADGLRLVGVAQIRPASPGRHQLVPKSGPYRIVFMRMVTPTLYKAIAHDLLLQDISLDKAGTDRIEIPLKDASGETIGALSWQQARPGYKALLRTLPLIAVAMLMFLGIAGFVGRQGLRSIERLATLAMVDSLSGLPNRRAIRREMEQRLARGEKVSLAMIDLDGFKAINDNYGHNVGDRLIRVTADMLVEMLGGHGSVARLGGDEFAIMTAGPDAIIKAEVIAQDLLARLSRPFRIDERTVVIGASIGLASTGMARIDAGELMRRADIAMYAAKSAGKMRLAWYDEHLDQKQATAHLIEMELRDAIERDEFELLYQPVHSLADGKISAVEALLRWTSPTRGEVAPSQFIPIAEASGLIDRIGMHVLHRACVDGLAWPEIHVSVNVSAAQLRNPDFPARLGHILAETGFPAHRLELEITESYLVYDPETARKILSEVKALGVGVALDDFGTGYASIGFLRQFSFTKLKLDRSLVIEAGDSEAARSVLQASIAVARALKMAVTAEGVETDAQADMMRIAGCDELQGWLFSHAVDAQGVSDAVASAHSEYATRNLRVFAGG